MNYSLLQLLHSGTWSVDLNTFMQYQGIADAILRGANFSLDATPNLPAYFVDPLSENKLDPSDPDSNMDLVAIHQITGLMLKYDAPCGPVGMKTFANGLLIADSNPNIAAHVMIIDSGGGQSSSINPLKQAFSKLKKPVVAFVDDVAASAGYYAASLSDHIMAGPDASVGSIGVFIAFSSRTQESVSEDGLIHKRIYADTSPDKNIEMEEAIKGNFSLIRENLLNPIDARFMADVRLHRPDVTEKQLQGGILSADQCVGSLVDSLGTLEDAINLAFSLSLKSKPKPNTMSKKNYPAIAKSAMVEQLEVEAQQGLHLDASLADMLETNLVMMQSQLETMENLAEGESVKGLRDQIADLTAKLTAADDAVSASAVAESASAELVTGLRSSIDGLKLEVQQANRIITAKDAEIETLSKIPAVVLTQVPDPQDHLQVKKTADPEADHYYRLSQFGKK